MAGGTVVDAFVVAGAAVAVVVVVVAAAVVAADVVVVVSGVFSIPSTSFFLITMRSKVSTDLSLFMSAERNWSSVNLAPPSR